MAQKKPSPSHSDSSSSSRHGSRQDSWEIVEGVRGELTNEKEPEKHKGFLLKKRKWPMKGWHKRYFFLEKGILKYAKSATDILKGKLHGCIDVGLSVMSINEKSMCIDLDTEENIYHLKVKSQELFEEWVSKLRHHRIYRQNEIAMYPHERAFIFSQCAPSASPSLPQGAPCRKCGTRMRQSSGHPAAGFLMTFSPQAKLQLSEDMEKCTGELLSCESYLLDLQHLLRSMEVLHRTCSAPAISPIPVHQASTFNSSPKKEKRSHRKWRSKNYSKDAKMTLQVPSHVPSGSVRLHASNPNLSTVELNSLESPVESPNSPTDVSRLQEDFCTVAEKLHTTMKSAFSSLSSQRDRLKQVLELETHSSPASQVLGLNSSLISDSYDGPHPLVHQTSNGSRTSIPDSLSEFVDAQEVLLSSSSSENEVSDDDSYASDVSDYLSTPAEIHEVEKTTLTLGTHSLFSSTLHAESQGCVENGPLPRRSCLPSPSSSSSISLWNILKNNIGKDLSKVAMPVVLNEPLNTLQRLCEELEYSELLDKAASTVDPFERMVYVATFAISGYASSCYRAGAKPFNPVLGETYECIRPEKGFRFIAEQVSHHPPVSACHSESQNFTFWQDIRWKNKFWGKSMEIVPMGSTHLVLPGFGDHYEWNKVTSCIHNILNGQRWIEHYGEISIKNSSSDICQCKITFLKTKHWNSVVNEVEGVITDQTGRVMHKLFGKWNEAIYCGEPPSATCIWKANAMPADYEQYYGFTKFAMELNELDPELKPLLPPTDTRFRIDQRLLEEGNVEAAEEQKRRIEQLQRERQHVLEEKNMTLQPRFFKKSSDDTWVSNNTYWELRRDPGFANLDCPVLW
ncbi:oxysterol-binding protein-related protein 3a isoform X2 [Scleropages formosus]|uniref:oxysterol-binding protein-related protein 3a isoform X2 n=1 Tax=Scleropages formosus TaxID=113540 RepID=UPI0008791908|nr:oxysterol-binding protein-related protein 3-like isoform X2 [Scleropages formosus]